MCLSVVCVCVGFYVSQFNVFVLDLPLLHVCACVCLYVYACTFMCVCVRVYVCLCVFVRAGVCVCVAQVQRAQ